LSIAALVLAVSTGTSALAMPITYEYGGMITSADSSTGVAPGTRFSGTFTYDPKNITGGVSDTGDQGALFFGNIPGWPSHPTIPDGTGLSLHVGGHPVDLQQGGLVVDTNASESPGGQGYGAATGLVGPFTVIDVSNTYGHENPIKVTLDLKNPTNFVPASPLTLAAFPAATLFVTSDAAGSPSRTLYSGTIDSVTVVPEPASAVLLCVATAGWLARSGRLRARRI
jgi:hypothetical protein